MRRSPLLCRTGLAAAAAVLLTACGGGSHKEATASTSSSAASSSSQSASPTASPFCTQATTTLNGLAPAFSTGGSDPTKLAPVLTKAASAVRAIQPPAEIAADWAKLAAGLDQFAAAYASAGGQDAAAASAFQQRNAQLLAQLSGSAQHVQAYMSAHCGLPAGVTGSTAPTS